MDTFSKKQRSDIMRTVKSSGNLSTEIAIIALFKKYRIKGWRRNAKIIGNPDFFFPKKKVVVFADGCFWHGCNCKTLPDENREYWENKINTNIKRDKKISRLLRKRGYTVFRVKECKIKKGRLPLQLLILFNRRNGNKK